MVLELTGKIYKINHNTKFFGKSVLLRNYTLWYFIEYVAVHSDARCPCTRGLTTEYALRSVSNLSPAETYHVPLCEAEQVTLINTSLRDASFTR